MKKKIYSSWYLNLQKRGAVPSAFAPRNAQSIQAETPTPEKLYSEGEAAAYLKMTIRQLADRRRAGKIDCLKDGHFIAYTHEHLANYLTGTRRDTLFDPNSAERMLKMLGKQLRDSKRAAKHDK